MRAITASRWQRCVSLVVLVLLATTAGMTRAAGISGRDVAANCAACHGPDGRSRDVAIPSLAGVEKGSLVSALRAFREGRRPSTVMRQLAAGYSDEEIEAAAAYFSAQRP